MFKAVIIFFLSFLPFDAAAENRNEAEEMGHLAGMMYACNAHKTLGRYEQIVSRYFSNTTRSSDAERAKLQLYVRAKADAYSLYRKKRKFNCAEMVNDFSSMPIFKTVVYSDGSLKMPDGKYLYPRGQKKLADDAKKIPFEGR